MTKKAKLTFLGKKFKGNFEHGNNHLILNLPFECSVDVYYDADDERSPYQAIFGYPGFHDVDTYGKTPEQALTKLETKVKKSFKIFLDLLGAKICD